MGGRLRKDSYRKLTEKIIGALKDGRLKDTLEYGWTVSEENDVPDHIEQFMTGARFYDQFELSGYIMEYLNEKYGLGSYDSDAVRARIVQEYLKAWTEQTENHKTDTPRLYDHDFVENTFKAISEDIDKGRYRNRSPKAGRVGSDPSNPATVVPNAAGVAEEPKTAPQSDHLPNHGGLSEPSDKRLPLSEFDARWSAEGRPAHPEILRFLIDRRQGSVPSTGIRPDEAFGRRGRNGLQR